MAGGRGRGQGHPGGEDGRRPAVVPPAPGRSGERWSQACPGALKLCGRTGASAGLHLGGHNQGQQGGWQDSLPKRTLGFAPSTSIGH